MLYSLAKRHKRLVIVENDKVVYTPPGFIRHKIRSREQLQFVVDKFNEKGDYDIKAIIEFESQF